LCRYLAVRLKPQGVRVNVIVPGPLDTVNFVDTFGDETVQAIRERAPGMLLDPRGVARACLALCSGLMDSVSGQVIAVDEAWSLISPITYVAGHLDGFRFPDATEVQP
jgi:NAD(P)-dependent dehydrogenase (short-subunit alcohol dehydrogenase family)